MIGLESGCVFGNPIAPFVTNVNFMPIEIRYFPWISGGATIENTQVLVGCKKKILIYVRISAEKNTFSVHNANIKGTIYRM